jgi:hypothetical protein
MMRKSKAVYTIEVSDIQNVAGQELGRELTAEEIEKVSRRIADHVDWYGAVLAAI